MELCAEGDVYTPAHCFEPSIRLGFMNQQGPEAVSFLQENLLLIGIIAVVIFGYLLLLIRKRWKKGFRHDTSGKSNSPK